jgi:hypothetical protein
VKITEMKLSAPERRLMSEGFERRRSEMGTETRAAVTIWVAVLLATLVFVRLGAAAVGV